MDEKFQTWLEENANDAALLREARHAIDRILLAGRTAANTEGGPAGDQWG